MQYKITNECYFLPIKIVMTVFIFIFVHRTGIAINKVYRYTIQKVLEKNLTITLGAMSTGQRAVMFCDCIYGVVCR